MSQADFFMNLSWKFWKRNQAMARTPSAPPEQQLQAAWLPLSSSKELVGLQRIIGNQAVLELLVSRQNQSAAHAAANKIPHQSFWRKLRRN
jgi:hypothetical protein